MYRVAPLKAALHWSMNASLLHICESQQHHRILTLPSSPFCCFVVVLSHTLLGSVSRSRHCVSISCILPSTSSMYTAHLFWKNVSLQIDEKSRLKIIENYCKSPFCCQTSACSRLHTYEHYMNRAEPLDSFLSS